MPKPLILTKQNFLIMKNKFENHHQRSFACASKHCRKPFKKGDTIIRNSTGNRYYHKKCHEKMYI